MTTMGMQLNLFTGQPCRDEGAVVCMGSEAAPERPARKQGNPRAMHAHSLAASEHHQEEHRGRKALILDCLALRCKPMTDRQILEALYPDSDDMNRVRPRITELVREGRLMEAGEIEDPDTHETVRKVWLA
ncbi:MAG: hypothetical protein WCR06_07685 [bacterium]